MGHSHSHNSNDKDHDHDHDHDAEAANLFGALFGGAADPGSRITLIGLAANIGLSLVKAVAGVALNSASLVADAAHGLSDLIGDFVVLACWGLSRRPPSSRFQFGFGKFESLGSLIVSIFLLLGGVGIGMHSYEALNAFLWPQHEPASPLSAGSHSHHHHHHDAVDPQAAWVALGSVIVKELLYRKTLAVAKQEKSNVLEASALHHRSDAMSGVIALAAIVTSAFGLEVADPAGGLFVAAMIASQGLRLAWSAVLELLDASDPKLVDAARHYILDTKGDVDIQNIRSFKSGSYTMLLVQLQAKTDSVPTWAEVTDRENLLRMELQEWAGPKTEVITSWSIAA